MPQRGDDRLRGSSYHVTTKNLWWAGKDSNLGSRWQQIYSLPPLSTRVPALSATQCFGSPLLNNDNEQGKQNGRENTDTRPFLPAEPGEKGLSRFTLNSYGPFMETVDYIVT